MSQTITVTVPATSANLGPGFDALGLALNLHNRLKVRAQPSGLRIDITGHGAGDLPTDERNLAYRAMDRLFTAVGRRPIGLHLTQDNVVPVASGLGSSSAAIVGGLVAANALLDAPLSRAALLDMATAMEGHPDNVAPALLGGLTASLLDGDAVVCAALPVAELTVVVVRPRFKLATAEARAILPATVPFGDAVFNIGRIALLLPALQHGNIARLRLAMRDRLHQPYRAALIPGFDAALAAAHAHGAAAALSGAGPTLVAFTDADHAVVEQAVVAAFAAAGVACDSWQLAIDRHGARVERS